MPPRVTLTVYNNNGTEVLGSGSLHEISSTGEFYAYITATGINADATNNIYTYTGSGKWLGVSKSPNTTTAEYGPDTALTTPTAIKVYAVIKNTVSIDLSTLSGYSSIISGTHNIAVKAKATGYMDSDLSASVPYIGPMPAKGDLIMLDGKQYRVLKINGTIAEVLTMYDTTSMPFNSATSSNTYAEQALDTYCNDTFYNSLSASMRSAIVGKLVTQDSWNMLSSVPEESYYTGVYGGDQYYYLTLSNAAFGKSIIRHCYCLSVQDVLDYLEATTSMNDFDTTLTDTNILNMFWNTTIGQKPAYTWLSSADSSDDEYAFRLDMINVSIGTAFVGGKNAARPAFQIDLSKVEWTR